MNDTKPPTNAPFEIIRQTEGVTSWAPPSMNVKGKVVQSAIKERKRPKNESIEDLPPAKRPAPLTADALQKMAAEAKEEGFAEGRAEGLANGHTEGYNKGIDEGSKKAYQETLSQLESERARLKAIADELFTPMKGQQVELETIIVDMVVNLTKKLVQAELNTDPTLLFNLVNRAVNELPVGAKNIRVELNKEDAELMAGLAEDRGGVEKWPIELNPSLASGGCRVISDESLIDFDLTNRLNKFFEEAGEQSEDWDADNNSDSDLRYQEEPLIERPAPKEKPAVATAPDADLDLDTEAPSNGTVNPDDSEQSPSDSLGSDADPDAQ